VLLPILLYPITIPVIIAGVTWDVGAAGIAAGGRRGDDVARHPRGVRRVSITLALWTFEPLMTD